MHFSVLKLEAALSTEMSVSTNTAASQLKILHFYDPLLLLNIFAYTVREYKRSWIQHVNRMPRNRLPRVMKYYSPNGRRNHGRLLKRLPDT